MVNLQKTAFGIISVTNGFQTVKIYQFFRVVLLQIRFGSGAARIRVRNDFFRIRIRIHNSVVTKKFSHEKNVGTRQFYMKE
jgi:hypothetical protein